MRNLDRVQLTFKRRWSMASRRAVFICHATAIRATSLSALSFRFAVNDLIVSRVILDSSTASLRVEPLPVNRRERSHSCLDRHYEPCEAQRRSLGASTAVTSERSGDVWKRRRKRPNIMHASSLKRKGRNHRPSALRSRSPPAQRLRHPFG